MRIHSWLPRRALNGLNGWKINYPPRSGDRDDILNGAADLGVDLEEHIAFCIEAMKGIAGELGLAGNH